MFQGTVNIAENCLINNGHKILCDQPRALVLSTIIHIHYFPILTKIQSTN